MLVRNCAGGVVFCSEGNKVFLLKNEKGEWVFPKGVIPSGSLANQVALNKVKEETGITAEIVSTAGHTNYEFYSVTRQRPVCNKIIWYVMRALDDEYKINNEKNFTDGGFFDIEQAMDLVTYSQDKSLLSLSFNKYKDEMAV
jgi:8-oxo-dGTP pyrophosphatase MutT (NUDIX family)